MMTVSFTMPWMLLVSLPLGVLMWYVRPIVSQRGWVADACRVGTVIALSMALAAPVITQSPRAVGVVVVRDLSASIDSTARRQQADIIAQLQRTQPAAALLGIVDVAAVPVLAAMPQVALRDTTPALQGDTNATALADAVLLAASIIPGEYIPHVLVLSDGNETRGRLRDIVDVLAARHVIVDVLPLQRTDVPPQLALTAVDAPQRVRGNGEVALTLVVESAVAQQATITVSDGATLVRRLVVALKAGTQRVFLSIPTLTPGIHRLDVTVAAATDDQRDDNQQQVLIEQSGPPRLLVLADPLDRAQALVQAWQRMGVDVTTARPREISAQLTSMASYDVIVLVDTPARLVPMAVMSNIATVVHALGKGFLWVGGAESFAAGGYRRTPLADIAAVALEPRDPTQRKRLDLLLVIDHSGSMADGTTALSKLDLAKEAAYRAIRNLQSGDTVGVAFFADTATWALPPQLLPSDEVVAQALGSIQSDGGTSIRSGLQLALANADGLTGDVHHVILLSDGIDTQSSDALAQALWRQQISLSTVALGADADATTLQRLATLGHGSAYQVRDPQMLADVFLDDTTRVASRDIVEAEVLPQRSANDAWLAPLQQIVPIYGYNRTARHDDTRVLLQIDPLTPLWAIRHVGLGQSMAWTSDLGSRWGRAWLAQDLLSTLAPLLITPLLPSRAGSLDMAWFWHDDMLDIDVDSARTTPAPQVTLIGTDGQQFSVPLQARGSTHWTGRTSDIASGEYVVRVTQQDAVISRSVLLNGRAERETRGGAALLSDIAQRTGGRVLAQIEATYWQQPPADFVVSYDISLWFVLAALVLFVGEIALRRVWFRLPSWRSRRTVATGAFPAHAATAPPVVAQPPSPPARIARLRAAKERARRDDLAE